MLPSPYTNGIIPTTFMFPDLHQAKRTQASIPEPLNFAFANTELPSQTIFKMPAISHIDCQASASKPTSFAKNTLVHGNTSASSPKRDTKTPGCCLTCYNPYPQCCCGKRN